MFLYSRSFVEGGQRIANNEGANEDKAKNNPTHTLVLQSIIYFLLPWLKEHFYHLRKQNIPSSLYYINSSNGLLSAFVMWTQWNYSPNTTVSFKMSPNHAPICKHQLPPGLSFSICHFIILHLGVKRGNFFGLCMSCLSLVGATVLSISFISFNQSLLKDQYQMLKVCTQPVT